MAVELDHPFTTARPIDESFAAILDLERVVPCVEGGTVLERTGARLGQGRDPGQDGRDVDDVHRHRRGHRAGRGGPSRGAAGQVQARPAGRATPTRRSSSRSTDGGGTIHTNAQITGKAASMGEGVVAGVLDALIKDFSGEARRRSEARDGDDRDARDPRGRGAAATAGPRSRTTPTGRSSTATGPTTTSACSAATCWPTSMDAGTDDEEGARPLRPLLDGQRRGDRRVRRDARAQERELARAARPGGAR